MKYMKYFFLLAVIAGVLYFTAGQLLLPIETPQETRNCQEFVADWTQILENGTRIPVVIPGKCKAYQNERVVIETILPENLERTPCLLFLSHRQDMEIYVNGILRQQYSTKNTRLFGKTSSSAYISLDLAPADAGSTLTVVFQTDSAYSGVIESIYCGDKMSIWMEIAKEYGAVLIIAFIMLIIGISTVIISITLRIIYRKDINLEYLGWGTILVSIWILFDSMFRQLLVPNLSVASDITFYSVALLPLPFLLYMNTVQNRRYEKWYFLVSTLVILDLIACTALHITNIVDFGVSIQYMLAVFVGSILFLAVTIITDIARKHAHEYRLIICCLALSCLTALIQILLYMNHIETAFSGVLIAFGLIFLLFTAVVDTARDLLDVEREKQQAVLANQAKASFLANMSHEIRTPINAILGMNEIILRESSEEHVLGYANDIQAAGRTLLSLVNDILDFSKIESGKLEIIPVEYDISSLLNDCYNMIAARAEAKQLDFQIRNNPDIPKRFLGDEIRIRQIMINLLTNAIKYTPEGSVVLSLDGRKLEDHQYLLQITVSDTGVGISEENQAKLFHSFQRLDEQKNRHIEGSGLGLTIAKQLVDLMDGTISVESECGTGSVFRVELPQTITCEEVLGSFSNQYLKPLTSASGYHEHFHAPEGHILIVDDVPMNLKVVRALLKNTRLQIDTAESGEQCLSLVKQHVYHVIFMDHMMPDMDGIQTLFHMREMEENKNKNTPVIMLTANAIVGAREEYLTNGFVDYLSKPIQQERLEQILLKYLPSDLILEPADSPDAESAEQSDAKSSLHQEKKPFSLLMEKLYFLDTDVGLSYCKNDELLYRNVLISFLNTDYHNSLAEYYQQQDWENYRIPLHNMKSTTLSIGAASVSEKAKALENALDTGNLSYVTQCHDAFIRDYRQLLARLAATL